MFQTKIAGLGYYVPEKAVTNDDLAKVMDTSDTWIQERTGIKKRHYADKHKETSTTLGAKAAKIAIERAGITPEDVDFIIFATLSPDYYFPGCGVLLQRELGITKTEIAALDITQQCSGFVYGLSVADQFIKTGMYKNILLVGAEMHSMGLDFSTRGRGVTVIFGDGAGAAILQPTQEEGKGILTTKIHSDGTFAEKLAMLNPGSHGGYHLDKQGVDYDFGYDKDIEYGEIFMTHDMINNAANYPHDLDMFIPHQANLRISQFVQKRLGLKDEQVWNNIQKYGNTTAASIPIALTEAWEAGKIKDGDLVCLAAFGSGFTWGSALIRW